MQKIYLQRVPTSDKYSFELTEDEKRWLSTKKDVVCYLTEQDVEFQTERGRWMWYSIHKPKRNKKKMVYQYLLREIVWLEDKE